MWLLDAEGERFVTEYHAVSDVYTFRFWSQKPPTRWSLTVGNIVHQLRATLDNLIWQLVIECGGEPRGGVGGNQYPIYSQRHRQDGFAKRTKSSLRGVSDEWVALIEETQPYIEGGWTESTPHPLEELARLSNLDKHQLLRVVATLPMLASGAPIVSLPDGVELIEFDTLPPPIWRGGIFAWGRCDPTGYHDGVGIPSPFTGGRLSYADGGSLTGQLSWIATAVEWIVLRAAQIIEHGPAGGIPIRADVFSELFSTAPLAVPLPLRDKLSWTSSELGLTGWAWD